MKITNKYVVETIVFLSYVLFAMAWVGGTASMSQIMQAMQINSLADASFISGAVTFAKIVGTFLAAWLAIKIGVKYAFFISTALVAIGVFTPIAENYDILLISRFLMGLGGALMIVYFNPIVLRWFDAEERATINGLNAVAFNVGTAVILWGMPLFNELFGGWKNSLLVFSAVTAVLAVMWLLVDWDKEADDAAAKAAAAATNQAPYGYLQGLKDKFVWNYSLCYSGLLAFYICLFTFYPKAGIVASKWVIGFGIVGIIAGILYSRKIKARVPIIRWCGLAQVAMVIGLTFSSNEIVQTLCAIVLGFVIFLPVTALVTIPHELKGMTAAKITVIFSLFWSISYLVATVILWFFGKLVDMNNGDYFSAFVLITVVSTSFFLFSFLLPEPSEQEA